jgi:hypothetical protein
MPDEVNAGKSPKDVFHRAISVLYIVRLKFLIARILLDSMPKCHYCGIIDDFVESCEKYHELHCILCCVELSEKEGKQLTTTIGKAAEALVLFLIPLIAILSQRS